MPALNAHLILATIIAGLCSQLIAADAPSTTITVTIDRGQDVGQSFGSLFEIASEDGELVIGAGFQNLYNTAYRADRHAVEFFVRPTSGERKLEQTALPRPNDLCGTYLYTRDGVVHSTYGGHRAWHSGSKSWREEPTIGGTEETMRVGRGILAFGNSLVTYDGQPILSPPAEGDYRLFYYANGYLCFYHVNRKEGVYRPYTNDADGFSKLYACPWTPGEPKVDLSQAIVLTLPVVGETTFAWGQLGDQIVTGSNIGGFYVFKDRAWKILLQPNIGVSYQLYSTMAFHDRLVMGQYPTGRLFEYDGEKITDRVGWPPKLDGVSASAREAQTTVIYGGDMFVGVWPWGELWRYNPDSDKWTFAQRMFEHPALTDKVVHPYEDENRGNPVGNHWGQRVTSLVTAGNGLFVSTSAKSPSVWNPEQNPFLAPDLWKSYGSVYQLTMPGHLSATTNWTDGPTTLKFTIHGAQMKVEQDGQLLATTTISGPLAEQLRSLQKLKPATWGTGLYGQFRGQAISGSVSTGK